MLLPQHHFTLPPKTLTIPFLSISQKPKVFSFTKKFVIRSSKSESESDTEIASKSAIQRIAEKLRSLGHTETLDSKPNPESNSAGEIFVPLPHQLPKYRVGHTIDTSWSTPEIPVPAPDSNAGSLEKKKISKGEEDKVPTLAELNLSKKELRRLRLLGMGLSQKLKIGKAGITEGIVNGIHERWRSSEVVKIECEDVSKMNMKRTHDFLERKTGGLVVWRSGSKIALYRGANYKYPYFSADEISENNSSLVVDKDNVSAIDSAKHGSPRPTLIRGVGSPNRVRFQLPGEAKLVEEADRLLDGLGPRFGDWWGYEPLPVDGDLLPAVVPGYRRPFRLLPYGLKPILTNDEMTTLKRLGQPLPWHFVLGRNRKLQGLAASIVKLWEKCEVAKIAVKREVENADSETMAEELKYLTGGSLLSRDKDFIVLYRGKDFLPSSVSSSIEERRKHVIERKKQIPVSADSSILEGNGSYNEKEEEDSGFRKSSILEDPEQISSTEAAIQGTKIELSKPLEKKEKAEIPRISETDNEGITAEEREMLQKIGLKMKAFLQMGRRGVFAGTIENMHLHWKYRELVKIVANETNIKAAYQVARTLEAESGGILIAVEKISKGYAIVVYRGKNYQRPASIRPKTLLTKREATKRTIEEQRNKALNLHILKFNKNIDEPEHQIEETDILRSDEPAESVSRLGSSSHSLEITPGFSAENVELLEKAGSDSEAPSTSSELNDTTIADTNSYRRNLLSASEGIEGRKRLELTPFIADVIANDPAESSSEFSKSILDASVNNVKNTTAPGAPCLSNKDRLLLRKQALKMNDRPVLAVGRSNVVTGVAKLIKEHFKKHPFAIVNVKGRAKGTSVQDVMLKLQEATGAVFISQEPNKVILYRGWGAKDDDEKTSVVREVGNQPTVSPELIAAIKLECGLAGN